MRGSIDLTGMRFHAYHGVLEKERIEGNIFVVDFHADLDLGAAAESDNLEDTLDYGEIYDIVAEQMAIPSQLLEHVTGRIIRAIEQKHPELHSYSIKVSKHNPPVAGEAEWSSVTLYHD